MKVLITDMRHASAAEEKKVLDAAGIELDTTFSRNEDELIENGAGAVGFLVSYAKITRRVMQALPELKVIVKYGIGVDTIDLEAATELGKYVANIPDYCTEEVALHALALALSGLRMVPKFSMMVRTGIWEAAPEGVIVYRPSRERLGLVGFGRIARKLHELARPIFMETVFFDPFVDASDVTEQGVRKVDTLSELFAQASVVSVHTPLTPKTANLVDSAALSHGKAVVLVNTGRGGVVSEAAVRTGLEQGWLSFFGADVYWQEPPDFNDPETRSLLEDPRVSITPHVAWCSTVSAQEVRRKAAEEVVRVTEGGRPLNIVNRDILLQGERKS